ncbi:MAG: prepilin peptidase [candidate division WOR-3 bacterium]|nr:prepilin peptidase [candidate division WOR-3 bacterium]MCX7757633.1 prepilin peptidase [candidate division WOR-3 bacterium]MDW7987459.1 prepilin peptidase [candidate division WOR-3 bacterium]
MVIIVFILGLIIGSFLNVCIYRIPRHISIVYPPSRCWNCHKPIKPYDNIPLISYLILKGRCRYCKKKISWRYPLVEMLTACLFVLLYFKFGLGLDFIKQTIFIALLIIIGFIDFEFQIIPNSITFPGIIVGLFLNYRAHNYFREIFGGVLLCAGILWLFRMIGFWIRKQEMMGLGDVKLAAMVGAFLGLKNGLLSIFIGVLLGILVWSILMLLRLRSRKDLIPFGSFMAIGCIIAVFLGELIIKWYWGVFNLDY